VSLLGSKGPKDGDLLTVHDVAKLAGVTTQTVRTWADAGTLEPYARTGGGIRIFLRSAVDAFLEKRRDEAAS
jgi:excisionase family DNA binding protein